MKSRRMVMRAWVAGAVCEEPSVVGRVNGEACGESSRGPSRSGTKFRGTDGKEQSRGCTATRCSSDSIACFPRTSVHVAAHPDSRGLYIHRARVQDPYRPVPDGPLVSRAHYGRRIQASRNLRRRLEGGRPAELVDLGGTPEAPGKRVRRLHGEAEVPFREQGVRERAGLCEDVGRIGCAIKRG
jgi:hypothetical protein